MAKSKEYTIDSYRITEEPYYEPVGNEIKLFEIAFKRHIPVLLKGPTGCGKSRFIHHMAHKLNVDLTQVKPKKGGKKAAKTKPKEGMGPLVSVHCHEDLCSDDLIGRYLLSGDFMDGPALVAVKHGGILYLDEVVEARKDVTVITHPLADRSGKERKRTISVEKTGQVYEADPNFMLVMSYNPGYQNVGKELKQSTKQRFITLEFGYPPADIEQKIIETEAGVGSELSRPLVEVAGKIRNLKGKGLDEGASTRLLIYAAELMQEGIAPQEAINVAILDTLTDKADVYKDIKEGLEEVVKTKFP